MSQRSTTARGALILASTAAGGLVLGVGGVQLGVLRPYQGFKIAVGLGLGFGLLGLVASLLAMIRTSAHVGRSGRSDAWTGLGLALAALLSLIGPLMGARGLPPIHDATTDIDDPPMFSERIARAPDRMNSVIYPEAGSDVPTQQREAYPDLRPIVLPLSPPEALERSRGIAERLGWQVDRSDEAALVLEARATSRIFRFVDDIVVRIRPGTAGGSIVDLRSNSRVGGGDLGANARRIRAFRDALIASAGGE